MSSGSAERGALSAVFVDQRSIDELREKVPSSRFADPQARKVYECMLSLRAANTPINVVTVGEALGEYGLPAEIEVEFGDPGSMPAYITIINSNAQRRDISGLATFIQNAGDMKTETLLTEIERRVEGMRSEVSTGILPASVWAREALDSIEDTDNESAIKTGLPTLDATCSIRGGNVITLAARPGMGKTALAGHLCSVDPSKRIGFFSYEMSTIELAVRQYAAKAGIDGFRIRDQRLTTADWKKLIEAGKEISNWGLHFDDDTTGDWPSLAARIRRFCADEPTDLIVIDYLQLLIHPAYAAAGRNNEIGAISRGVKLLAKQTNVPILCLSQLNREGEKGGQVRAPRLTDLRDSGAIEQDADIVWMLHRQTSERLTGPTQVQLIVAKNRHGAQETVNLTWFPATYAFQETGTGWGR